MVPGGMRKPHRLSDREPADRRPREHRRQPVSRRLRDAGQAALPGQRRIRRPRARPPPHQPLLRRPGARDRLLRRRGVHHPVLATPSTARPPYTTREYFQPDRRGADAGGAGGRHPHRRRPPRPARLLARPSATASTAWPSPSDARAAPGPAAEASRPSCSTSSATCWRRRTSPPRRRQPASSTSAAARRRTSSSRRRSAATSSSASLPGHKYAIQITMDQPQWGGLSGCTFEEAQSWRKIAAGRDDGDRQRRGDRRPAAHRQRPRRGQRRASSRSAGRRRSASTACPAPGAPAEQRPMKEERFYPPFGFLAPRAAAHRLPRASRVVILPVPYDATTTARAGARDGPARHHPRLAGPGAVRPDARLRHHACTASTPCRSWRPTAAARRRWSTGSRAAVGELLDAGKFVVTLGGEHTVAVGAVRAHARRYPDLSVLAIDAHADLRDEYLDSPYNHACVMRRIVETCPVVRWACGAPAPTRSTSSASAA